MINLENIHFGYRKKQTLFDHLDLQIPSGNIYGLLGRNGAGKTSLLKLISGLVFPKEGTIEVLGYTPKDRMPSFLSDIYFIPEELHIPNISIAKYEQFYAPFYPKFDSVQFRQYLKDFDLTPDKKMTGLSYGQKKKVITGFGLATNSRLLILDEPTNGLDIPSKSLFRKLLAGAITDDRTFIISTHQVRDMGNLMDPIIILDNGQIIFQQALEAITQRLTFELSHSLAEPEETLYAERVPGGYLAIHENVDGEETDVDIEVLFNAIVANQAQFQEIFRG
jgi:ABC-2 type transport system ATP-binding protein